MGTTIADIQHAGGDGGRRIIARAKELFMTRGYRAVSTRDIAEAAGVTQPALYHHFRGKEALYVAVLEDELSTSSSALWEIARQRGDAGHARLEQMATVLARSAEHDLAQMFHDLKYELRPETRERIAVAFAESIVSPLVSVLEAMESEASVAPIHSSMLSSHEAAMFVLSIVRTLSGSAQSNQESLDRAAELVGAKTVRLVCHGLGQAGGDTSERRGES